jgi:hypothetical protein
LVRAIEQAPRTCGSSENSAFRFAFLEPLVPGRWGRRLRHEARDDAVTDDMRKTRPDRFLDPLDMTGREIGAKLDHDVAPLSRLNQVLSSSAMLRPFAVCAAPLAVAPLASLPIDRGDPGLGSPLRRAEARRAMSESDIELATAPPAALRRRTTG